MTSELNLSQVKLHVVWLQLGRGRWVRILDNPRRCVSPPSDATTAWHGGSVIRVTCGSGWSCGTGTVHVYSTGTRIPVKRPGGSRDTPALSTPFRGSPHASKTARLVQSNLAHARRAVPITCPPSQTVSHCSLYSSVITSHHVLSTPISDSISVCSCRSEHRSAAQLRSCEGWSCSPKDDLR